MKSTYHGNGLNQEQAGLNQKMPSWFKTAPLRMPKSMRVLIYSQDGYGLGHLRRNISIIRQIKKLCPSASVLIIVDSPAAPFFQLPPQCDFIKIPTMIKVDYGIWQSNHLNMSSTELIPVRAEIIQNVAISFQPQIFLVDHMPQGACGELAGPLRAIKQCCPHTRMVLGLRDILGAPEDICRQWTAEGAYEITEQFYDQVLIYGSPDIFHTALHYNFPESILNKTTYCGYVCRDDLTDEFSNEMLKKLIPPAEVPLIFVAGGGGHDADQFMKIFLDAVRILRKKLKFKAVVSTGPFMEPHQIQTLKRQSRDLGVAIEELEADAIQFLDRADLLISMAGYNTTCEILRFRKNAIIIPRPGPSAEQTIRTNILAKRNLISAIHPDELSPTGLAELILHRLKTGSNISGDNVPNLEGAQNAALLIMGLASNAKT